jgi:hypothetical protein
MFGHHLDVLFFLSILFSYFSSAVYFVILSFALVDIKIVRFTTPDCKALPLTTLLADVCRQNLPTPILDIQRRPKQNAPSGTSSSCTNQTCFCFENSKTRFLHYHQNVKLNSSSNSQPAAQHRSTLRLISATARSIQSRQGRGCSFRFPGTSSQGMVGFTPLQGHQKTILSRGCSG